jgi:hypothetical protein
VAELLAVGGTFSATYPAGPDFGKPVVITVPKVLVCGTLRPNRCGEPKDVVWQTQGMGKKALEKLIAKPLAEVSVQRSLPPLARIRHLTRARARSRRAARQGHDDRKGAARRGDVDHRDQALLHADDDPSTRSRTRRQR